MDPAPDSCMSKTSISQSVIEAIEPIIRDANLELVDVEYKKAGRSWVLRVYIDSERGIALDDCQRVSRQIEDAIEVDELIPSAYVLEVSSPGLDRPLKNERDFLKYKNQRVSVHTYAPIGNRKNFTGKILDVKDQTLYLEVDGETVRIDWDQISKAKLIIEI